MGASPILEHAEDAKTPHRILVRSLLTSRNKLRASIASSRRIASGCATKWLLWSDRGTCGASGAGQGGYDLLGRSHAIDR